MGGLWHKQVDRAGRGVGGYFHFARNLVGAGAIEDGAVAAFWDIERRADVAVVDRRERFAGGIEQLQVHAVKRDTVGGQPTILE